LVVRNEVLVVERPVGAGAIEGVALQILLRIPVTVSAPDVGAPAGDAHAALPRKRLARLGGVRLVDVVAEPVRVVLGAGVAVLLHGLLAADEIVGARLV